MRKLLGTVVFVVFTIAYFWVTVSIALVRLPSLPTWTHFVFYIITVLVWVAPSAWLIRWMQRPVDAVP